MGAHCHSWRWNEWRGGVGTSGRRAGTCGRGRTGWDAALTWMGGGNVAGQKLSGAWAPSDGEHGGRRSGRWSRSETKPQTQSQTPDAAPLLVTPPPTTLGGEGIRDARSNVLETVPVLQEDLVRRACKGET